MNISLLCADAAKLVDLSIPKPSLQDVASFKQARQRSFKEQVFHIRIFFVRYEINFLQISFQQRIHVVDYLNALSTHVV